MVGKRTLRDYGFRTMQEYYDMIETSKINGQISQCIMQFKALNKEQKKDFISYLADQTNSNKNEGDTPYYPLLKLLIEEI